MRCADVPLDLALRPVRALAFRLPGRSAAEMAELSQAEAGGGLDMLEACERTARADLRRQFFLHALDQLRRSRLFRQRAAALAQARSRTTAVLEDSGYIASHGIRGADPLYSELGELRFLAYVWLAERRSARRFAAYQRLMAGDPAAAGMFAEIGRDGLLHVTYSRAELDLARQRGEPVTSALWAVRRRCAWQAWMRFSRRVGDLFAGLWLAVVYLVVLGPFSLLARLLERDEPGLLAPEADDRSAAQRAWEQA